MRTLESVQQDIQEFERRHTELAELTRLIRDEPGWTLALPVGLDSPEARDQAERGFNDALEHAGRMNRHIEQFRRNLPALSAIGDTPERRQVLDTLGTHLDALTGLLLQMNGRLRTTLNALRQQRGAPEYVFVPPDSN